MRSCLQAQRVGDAALPSERRNYNGALPARMAASRVKFQPLRGATNRRQHSG
jgi:hypothetical protein